MADNSENRGQDVQEKHVERATVAADGSIVIPCCEGEMVSVDVADVDLLLGFSDGTYVVIPNGALDALSGSAPPVVFVDPPGSAFSQAHYGSDHIATLDELFKMVGTTDPAKAGSLRVSSEGLEAAQDGAVEVVTVQNDALPTDQEIEVFTADSGTGAGDLVPHAELAEAVLLDPVVPDIPPRPSVAAGQSGHKVYQVDPTISLNNITADNIVNIAESDPAGTVTITGITGGTAVTGDRVIVTVGSYTVSTTVQDDHSFSVDVPGDILAPLQGVEGMTGLVDAEVVDQNGTSAFASVEYSIDTLAPEPTITLDPIIAGDGIVNQGESQGTITITGTVSEPNGENLAGDLVTLTINGNDYQGYVRPDGHNFSISVPGSALAPALGVEGGTGTIDARIDSADSAGNPGFAVDLGNSFGIDTAAPAPAITVDDITADNIVNIAESGGEVAVTGTVTGGKIGDSVFLTVNGVDFSGSVRADGSYSINVRGSDLLADYQADGIGNLHARTVTYDAAGNLGQGDFDKGYAVDDAPPSATISFDDTALNIGDSALVTITFDAPVSDFSNADLTVENGTLTAVSSSDGGRTWTATLTPDVPVEDPSNLITLNNAGVRDLAGNPGVGTTTSPPYAIDTLEPEVIDVSADDLLLTDADAGQSLTISVTFSEAMDTTVAPTLELIDHLTGTPFDMTGSLLDSGGAWDATGTVFSKTYLVQDGGIDIDALDVDVTGALDAAGNAILDYSAETEFGIDTLNPMVTIGDDNTDGVVSSTDSLVTYTLTFSEEISSLVYDPDPLVSDLTISGGDFVDGSLVLAADGRSATFQVVAYDSSYADLVVTVHDTVTDLSGNTLVEASHTLPVDTLNPRVTITTDNLDGIVSDNDSLVTFYLDFDKPVTGVADTDLSISGGTLVPGSIVMAGDGLSGSFQVLAADDSTTALDVGVNGTVVDFSGRPLVPDSVSLPVDTVNATVTIGHDCPDNLVSPIDGDVNYTVTFSEQVASFSGTDLDIRGGVLLGGPVLAADGMSATFAVAANDNSTAFLDVTVKNSVVDLAGNPVNASSSRLSVDTLDPVVNSTILNTTEISDGTNRLSVRIEFSEAMDTTAPVSINFSQDVSGVLSQSAYAWFNGPMGNNSILVLLYDVQSADTDLGNVTLSISGGRDANGNLFQGKNNAAVIDIDTLNPSVGFADDSGGTLVTDVNNPVTYTLTFSEPVTSLADTDLTISGGTLTSGPVLAADGRSASFTVLADNESTNPLTVSVKSTVVDDHGNALTANSYTLAVDTVDYEPYIKCELYTSSEFKVTGGAGVPAGAYVAGASEAEHLLASSPASQATRERIDGTSGNDVIDHNPNFSSGEGQWSKNLHIDFLVYDDLTTVELIADPSISGIPNFDLEAAGLVRTGDTWTLDTSDPAVVADLLANGLDVNVVYDVTSVGGPIDFSVVVNADGTKGGVVYNLSDTLYFSWRDASSTADFDLVQAGEQVMVLPRDGLGVEIYAGDGDDQVHAGAGHDLLVGGAGADRLDGGSGSDTVSYAGSAEDVVASLLTGLGSGGDAEGDQYISIENLTGGSGNDILIGDANANVFDGGLGLDTVSYADSLAGVTASLASGSGTAGDALGDSYIGIENLTGGAGADTLVGDDGDNILTGGGGGDALHGGLGSDTASYADASQGVIASLESSLYDFQTNDAQGDTFDQIENLVGSAHDDSLYGNTGDNILDGGLGDDRLYGSAGNDTLWADQGHDIARGDIGNDTFHISSDVANLPTTIDGGADSDTLVLDHLSTVSGTYDFSGLAGVDSRLENLEILDIREGADPGRVDAATTIAITGQDILNMVDSGTELTVLADNGDVLDLSAFTAVGETFAATLEGPGHTQFVISDSNGEIARIHWLVA